MKTKKYACQNMLLKRESFGYPQKLPNKFKMHLSENTTGVDVLNTLTCRQPLGRERNHEAHPFQ